MMARRTDRALVSDQAGSRLDPAGFDPSRKATRLNGWGLEVVDDTAPDETVAMRTARNLSWIQRAAVLASPDGDFPRPDVIKSRAKTLSWLIARGIYQRLGVHRDGRWLYRLTTLGAEVRAILRSGALEPPRPRHGWVPGEPREDVRWGARDSDEHPKGEDAERLSGEAMPARAEGIAQKGADHA